MSGLPLNECPRPEPVPEPTESRAPAACTIELETADPVELVEFTTDIATASIAPGVGDDAASLLFRFPLLEERMDVLLNPLTWCAACEAA